VVELHHFSFTISDIHVYTKFGITFQLVIGKLCNACKSSPNSIHRSTHCFKRSLL